MKTKLNSIKTSMIKTFRILRNISRNAIKELFNHNRVYKFKKFIREYRFYLIIVFIILLFIAKNIYTINSYNKQITLHNEKIVRERAVNNQLKEDLNYYKTDTYIIKTATEELNLRLVKDNKLYHGPIFAPPEGTMDVENTTEFENVEGTEYTENNENNQAEYQDDENNIDSDNKNNEEIEQ